MLIYRLYYNNQFMRDLRTAKSNLIVLNNIKLIILTISYAKRIINYS